MVFFTAIWMTPFIWHGHEMKEMNPTPRFELHCFRALVWNVINSLFFFGGLGEKRGNIWYFFTLKVPFELFKQFRASQQELWKQLHHKTAVLSKMLQSFLLLYFYLILPGDEFLVSPFGCRHGFLGTPWQYFRLWILKVNRLLANSNAKRCV